MKKVNKNLKLFLVAILMLAIIVISFLMYVEVRNPKFIQERVKLYSYNHNAVIENRITFKPNNILYGTGSTNLPGTYLSAFTDTVTGIFKYEFNGDEPVQYTGKYTIRAVMEGYIESDKQQKTLWKKTFLLVPETKFKGSNKKFSIIQPISFKLDQYNNFVKKLIADSKTSSPVKLSIYMNVDLNGKTDKGPIQEKASTAMGLPLNTDYFEIVKNEMKNKEGSIEETRKIQLPLNKTKLSIYAVLLTILLISILYLVFRTVGLKSDPIMDKLNTILKKHGERLVATNTDIVATGEKVFQVKSIDDLIKVADETSQPILYQFSHNLKDIHQFYVFNEGWTFVFDVWNEVDGDRLFARPKSYSNKPTWNSSQDC